jgi:biofilm protein TabA
MIKGKLPTADAKTSQDFSAAISFLSRDLKNLATGKHPIDSDKVFANIIEMTTSQSGGGKFESHRKYIDIHYIISGEEIIGVCHTGKLDAITEYDEKGDFTLYSIPEEYDRVTLKEGDFAIFFPEDAHMPGCSFNTPKKIRKVVVKFSLEDYDSDGSSD